MSRSYAAGIAASNASTRCRGYARTDGRTDGELVVTLHREGSISVPRAHVRDFVDFLALTRLESTRREGTKP